jgi:hypothetical protein
VCSSALGAGAIARSASVRAVPPPMRGDSTTSSEL